MTGPLTHLVFLLSPMAMAVIVVIIVVIQIVVIALVIIMMMAFIQPLLTASYHAKEHKHDHQHIEVWKQQQTQYFQVFGVIEVVDQNAIQAE